MRIAALILVMGLTACGTFGKGAPSTTSPVEPVRVPTTALVPTPAPASFVRSTAEVQVTRTIDVREGVTHAQGMRMLTDALNERFTVDVADPRAGFVMTEWQSSLRNGVPDLRYRTRVTARFLGEDWRRLQLRHEANWARGDEWDIGYDAPQLDSVTADLRTKLGKR